MTSKIIANEKQNISQQQIADFVESFKSKNILIVGDVMIDSYMWGKVNRISPEAPIPIVSVTDREFRLGGAANVALNIKALGANAFLCSVIGDDEKAAVFNNLLSQSELTKLGIIISKKRKTTVKTRIISGGQHLLRVDDEIISEIDNDLEKLLFEKISEICDDTKIDLILFQDYDKGVLTYDLIKRIILFAKSKDIKTSVDPKRKNFHTYMGVDLFKPNHQEFCEGIKLDIPKNDIQQLSDNILKFIATQSIDAMLLTLSEHGVIICDKNEVRHFAAEKRDITDVSGAGDTVISVASLLMSCGASISQIAGLSNLAGGLVCERTGVVPVTANDLLNSL